MIPQHRIQRFEAIAYFGRRGRQRVGSWRTWALAGTTVTAIAVAIIVGATGAGIADVAHPPPCALDPTGDVAAGRAPLDRWSSDTQARLRQVLSAHARPEASDVVERLVADIAGQHAAIGRQQVAACSAVRAGEISPAQQAQRAGCLQRRQLELAATVDLWLETQPTLADARRSLDATIPAGDCSEIASTALVPASATAADALWRRYVRSSVDRTAPPFGSAASRGQAAAGEAFPARARKHVVELTAIETAARAIGETELAARAAGWLAGEYKVLHELTSADEAAQRAHRDSVALHATHVTARALLDRSDIALRRDDPAEATRAGDRARQLADLPTTRPATRALIYHELARTRMAAGAVGDAVALARKALDTVQAGGLESPRLELAIRLQLGEALGALAGQATATLDLARRTVELAHEYVGDRDPLYGAAVGFLARSLNAVGDHTAAIRYHREAIEVLAATVSAEQLAAPRAELAIALYDSGDLRGAHHELAQLDDHAALDDQLRKRTLQLAAVASFEIGRFDEGIALTTEAYEDARVSYGKNAAATLDVRTLLATFRLETNRLDAAASDLIAIDRGYRTAPDASPLRRAMVRGTLAADLATARGKPEVAERAAREVLAASTQLRAGDRDRAALYHSLGTSLVAQKRWAAARGALQSAIDLQRRSHASPGEIAAVEIDLAVTEVGLGDRRAGLARARRARSVLDEFPGRVRARLKADALLGKRRPA